MKKLEGINKKETSSKNKNKVKSYVPSNLDQQNSNETEQTSLDASLEAAIEELKETAPQSGGDDDNGSSGTGGNTQSKNQKYTAAHIPELEEEIETTKESILSADNQGNEGILPSIILPSKLKELYEKEAFILNQKK